MRQVMEGGLRMQRLFICGAHSTGKTTLHRRLAERLPKFHAEAELARQVIIDMGRLSSLMLIMMMMMMIIITMISYHNNNHNYHRNNKCSRYDIMSHRRRTLTVRLYLPGGANMTDPPKPPVQ